MSTSEVPEQPSPGEVPRHPDATTASTTRYHHGDLRTAAIAAGLELARRGGPTAVGAREAARAVGVSPAALYRHFPDVDHLRAEVSCAARIELAHRLERARAAVIDSGDRRRDDLSRLREVGRAYIDFAVAEPHLFDTAFAPSTAEPSMPEEPSAWGVLLACIEAAGASGGIDPARLADAPLVAWTTVHGAATILVRSTPPVPLDPGHVTAVTLNALVRSLA